MAPCGEPQGSGGESGWRRRFLAEAGGARREGGDEGEEGADDDDGDADPDPGDERVEEDLDDGLVGVGVAALEDDVEVAGEGGVERDHGGGGLAGDVEALLGGELGDLLAVAVDVEEGEVGVVVRGWSPG